MRADAPGSLVALGDGRFALCGPLLAHRLARAARRRGRGAACAARERDAERDWLREALGALAY